MIRVEVVPYDIVSKDSFRVRVTVKIAGYEAVSKDEIVFVDQLQSHFDRLWEITKREIKQHLLAMNKEK